MQQAAAVSEGLADSEEKIDRGSKAKQSKAEQRKGKAHDGRTFAEDEVEGVGQRDIPTRHPLSFLSGSKQYGNKLGLAEGGAAASNRSIERRRVVGLWLWGWGGSGLKGRREERGGRAARPRSGRSTRVLFLPLLRLCSV